MSLLYESYTTVQHTPTVQLGDVLNIRFETKQCVEPSLLEKTLKQYDWTKKRLQLIDVEVHRKGGSVTLKLLPKFLVEPLTWIAIASIVASATGLAATIAKMWVVSAVANPLLAAGPLGFPMVFWLIIAAGGVLIPLTLIMRRR